MPARNAAGQSAFQNIVAIFTRAGLGMGGWVGRDFPFVGKKEPRIAKNCKESGVGIDNTELMPDRIEKQFFFTRPEIAAGGGLKDDFPAVFPPMSGNIICNLN
jgi:hypothetical protein